MTPVRKGIQGSAANDASIEWFEVEAIFARFRLIEMFKPYVLIR